MTCIVGYVDKGKVWIGGDSAATAGYDKYIYHAEEPKVFKRDNIIFGMTGSSRIGQLIRYALEIPTKEEGCADIVYLSNQLMPAMLKCFKNHQMFKIKDERIEESWGAIIGFNGKIYRVDGNFNLMRTNKNYVAHGAGQDFALGVFYALQDSNIGPKTKITKALEASAEFSTVVSPPFNIVEL